MKHQLKAIREARGLSQPELAGMVNTSRQQISRLEKGDRRLSDTWIGPLTQALGCSVAQLVGEEPISETVAIAGKVGAGAEIFAFDDSAKGAGIGEVERPPGINGHIVAVEVDGDSMLPAYRDRDILFYRKESIDDWTRHVGDECVVKVADGRMFVKVLRQGSKRGLAVLSSYNATDIVDVRIEWAAPILWVKRASRFAGKKLPLVRNPR